MTYHLGRGSQDVGIEPGDSGCRDGKEIHRGNGALKDKAMEVGECFDRKLRKRRKSKPNASGWGNSSGGKVFALQA